ncbi:hypothetical protein L1987_07635 [Smallanthus sonchifolius]|uniref:Uncharacterized protein n=1 Tax=Smallanthus sonchifolius TaxID=185202 RepID=A0ACB9K0Y5_9ASTR|nr:hypothetical protein L1987_07635 [Smallanthus sonchifolius]
MLRTVLAIEIDLFRLKMFPVVKRVVQLGSLVSKKRHLCQMGKRMDLTKRFEKAGMPSIQAKELAYVINQNFAKVSDTLVPYPDGKQIIKTLQQELSKYKNEANTFRSDRLFNLEPESSRLFGLMHDINKEVNENLNVEIARIGQKLKEDVECLRDEVRTIYIVLYMSSFGCIKLVMIQLDEDEDFVDVVSQSTKKDIAAKVTSDIMFLGYFKLFKV